VGLWHHVDCWENGEEAAGVWGLHHHHGDMLSGKVRSQLAGNCGSRQQGQGSHGHSYTGNLSTSGGTRLIRKWSNNAIDKQMLSWTVLLAETGICSGTHPMAFRSMPHQLLASSISASMTLSPQ
jgi:hypothetical protein